MLEPLTKRQAARLLMVLCKKHNVSPQAIVREVKDDGVRLSDTVTFCYDAGAYYLRISDTIMWDTHLHHQYVIFIDGAPKFSCISGKHALWMCTKLCDILPLCKEIRLYDQRRNETIRAWTQFKERLGQWVCS